MADGVPRERDERREDSNLERTIREVAEALHQVILLREDMRPETWETCLKCVAQSQLDVAAEQLGRECDMSSLLTIMLRAGSSAMKKTAGLADEVRFKVMDIPLLSAKVV
jgi:hypothetical protein